MHEIPVKLDRVLGEGEQVVAPVPVRTDLFPGSTGDGEVVAALDQGGVIEVHVGLVAHVVEEVGNEQTRTIDAIACPAACEDRNIIHLLHLPV